MIMIQKKDLDGNSTPIKSIIYAVERVQDNELKLDFWGRLFLNAASILGMILIMLGGLIFLMVTLIGLTKLGAALL